MRMIQKIPPQWLAPFLPPLRCANRNYRHARRICVGWWDNWHIRRTGIAMMPPARLRDRVHGVPDIKRFLTGGQRSRDCIERALLRLGRSLDNFERVLDFGCGCGRTLRWFEAHPETCRFYGTDIDQEAIAWCAGHIPFAQFQVNQALPPLAYEADMFDLIYSVSVLTHLDEQRQFRWLEELKRVARPSGILLLSIHGKGSWHALNRDEIACLKTKGFLYLRTDRWKGVFPDWYQIAYHTPDYVRKHFGKYFDVVEYLPQGLTMHQDFVLLRKTDVA